MNENKVIHCSTILLIVVNIGSAMDQGFELLFSSDQTAFENIALKPETPLPEWLQGTLIRNGLGKFEMGPRKFTHAFDAFAKLYSWTFQGNRTVSFSSKMLGTDFYNESLAENTVAPYLLFDSVEPPFSASEKVTALYHGIDNTNINIIEYGEKNESQYVAVSDFWQSYAFDGATLTTLHRVNADIPGGTPFGDYVPLPSSAHPVREFGTTNHINFVSLMNPLPFMQSYLKVIRIKNEMNRELIASIPVKQVPYMHSFGLSEHYAILFASPLYVNVKTMLWTARPLESLDWYPNQPTDIYVIDIRTGKYFKLKTETVFAMHFVNCFEKSNHIIFVDVVTYPDIDFMKSLQMKTLSDPVKRNTVKVNAELKTYVIDLKRMKVKIGKVRYSKPLRFIKSLDMPAINEQFRHRTYCNVYGLVLKSDQVNLSNVSLVKKNFCDKNLDAVWYKENHYPTEPWFVATPGSKQEDDGLIISLILDGILKKSYLLFLDAKTFKSVNKLELPISVPFTLHGRFFDNS